MSLKWSLVWAEVWGSHGGFLLVGRVTTEPGRWWFPRIQPLWLSLSCVCLCFPSSEPGIFPLSIFSPGTLDHPGIQSWTEVSGAVWCTPGFALRSVRFWRWFLRMGCAAFWGLTSVSGGLAGQRLSVCQPTSHSAHLPPLTLPLSIPSALPSFPLTALLFSPDWPALSFHHCALWMSVSLRQESENFCFFPKIQIENIEALCAVSIVTTHLCYCSTKTGKDHTLVNGCIPIKFYFQNQIVAVLLP